MSAWCERHRAGFHHAEPGLACAAGEPGFVRQVALRGRGAGYEDRSGGAWLDAFGDQLQALDGEGGHVGAVGGQAVDVDQAFHPYRLWPGLDDGVARDAQACQGVPHDRGDAAGGGLDHVGVALGELAGEPGFWQQLDQPVPVHVAAGL